MDAYTRPDWQHAALLTIDMQRDFSLPGAPAEVAGTSTVRAPIGKLVAAFRKTRHPIVHVVRLYQPDGMNADLSRRAAIAAGARIVTPGTAGAELVDELKPSTVTHLDAPWLLAGKLQEIGPNEWAMFKPRWGAFYATPLDAHLRNHGVNTVVICGCNYPNCPRVTIYEASERDYRVVFVADATSGVYAQGLQELASIRVQVITHTGCLAALA